MVFFDLIKDNLIFFVDFSKEEELIKDFFFYDFDVIDFVLIVEGKKLYVVKVVLIDVLLVFRKMLIGEFKEKIMLELEFYGKEFFIFVLFLRCIFLREEFKLIGK